MLTLKLHSLCCNKAATSCFLPALFHCCCQPLLCEFSVQQKRPYWKGRSWTDTDIGYLSFFAAMHATALIGGPLTFSWDAFHVMLAG